MAESVPGYIEARDRALEYDFETFVGGHLARLGDREDVRESREYVTDLKANTEAAIERVELGPIVEEVGPGRPWALFDAYLDAVAMLASLQVDYGVLGPLGLPD